MSATSASLHRHDKHARKQLKRGQLHSPSVSSLISFSSTLAAVAVPRGRVTAAVEHSLVGYPSDVMPGECHGSHERNVQKGQALAPCIARILPWFGCVPQAT